MHGFYSKSSTHERFFCSNAQQTGSKNRQFPAVSSIKSLGKVQAERIPSLDTLHEYASTSIDNSSCTSNEGRVHLQEAKAFNRC